MKLFYLAAILAISTTTANAISTTYSATVTADNHYALYVGAANGGSGMQLISRNEIGSAGEPGVYNWSLAESFDFTLGDGQAIYVAAWSDDAVAQGLLGQFCSGSGCINTGTDWRVMLTSNNLGDGSAAPSPSEMQAALGLGVWNTPLFLAHGQGPWGYIPNISQSAGWIWGSALAPGSGTGEFQIFCYGCTTGGTEVPEPASLLLFGIGAAGAACLRRRR